MDIAEDLAILLQWAPYPEDDIDPATPQEIPLHSPMGVDLNAMRRAIGTVLRSESQPYEYVEVVSSPTENGALVLRYALRDPLRSQYNFADHESQILQTPVQGQPDMRWNIGMTFESDLLPHSWNSEYPHLLIAGSAGAGKSTMVHSAMRQLMHNNDPADLQIWIAEPKNELQCYSDAPHVTKFVDSRMFDNYYQGLLEILGDVETALDQRKGIINALGSHINDAGEARSSADAEDLHLPTILVVVEECSAFFCRAVLPEHSVIQQQMMSKLESILLNSRAFDIHFMFVTQYPTQENLPAVIKSQCQRIGLRTADAVGSTIIIEQPGLEHLKQAGRGILRDGSAELQHFKGFNISQPDFIAA